MVKWCEMLSQVAQAIIGVLEVSTYLLGQS